MGKPKNIILNVPQPCHESWDRMTPNERGRHCANCNKTVIDFSNYTDKELAEFFKNVSGNVCGRLNNYQVNRPILITAQPHRSIFHKLFFGTALASWLGITASASAQTTHSNTIIVNNKIIDSKTNNQTALPQIKGKLIDSTSHQPIPFANVILSCDQSHIGTAVTDFDGYFTIDVAKDYINKKLLIEALYAGYIRKSFEFSPFQLPYYVLVYMNHYPNTDINTRDTTKVKLETHMIGMVVAPIYDK